MAINLLEMNNMGSQEYEELIKILNARFTKNTARHEGIDWQSVHTRLINNANKLHMLNEMERTGGEPDVIGSDKTTGEYVFCDCSAESPTGRRSLCYDKAALDGRKENKPKSSAVEMASLLGVELLTEHEYRELQTLGEFDKKTASWIKTPPDVRKLGGALFCDRRYGQVFTYHNGAESYYAARGFRGLLRV
jgi:hypothetical protein